MPRIRQVTSITIGPATAYVLEELDRRAVKDREVFNKSTYIESLIQEGNPELVKEFYR